MAALLLQLPDGGKVVVELVPAVHCQTGAGQRRALSKIEAANIVQTNTPVTACCNCRAMMDYAARPGLAAGMKRMPTLRMPAIESPSLTPHLQLQPLMLGGGAGDAINPASISLVRDDMGLQLRPG
jgi:hypothetical protein